MKNEDLKIYTDKSGWTTVKKTKEEALSYFVEMNSKYCTDRFNCGFAKTINEVIELKTPFKPKKCIHNQETYLEYCSELLDDWLEDADKYIRPVTEDDECIDEAWTFIYTNAGSKMVERAIRRLTDLGEKHFGYLNENISCSRYQEY